MSLSNSPEQTKNCVQKNVKYLYSIFNCVELEK